MAKSSNTGEPKARRTPARRRTDKAAPAVAAAHAAEMASVSAPAGLGTMVPGHQALQAMSGTEIGEPLSNGGPTLEAIERRAYEIYLERGGQEGRAIDDWLEAERQLRGR